MTSKKKKIFTKILVGRFFIFNVDNSMRRRVENNYARARLFEIH